MTLHCSLLCIKSQKKKKRITQNTKGKERICSLKPLCAECLCDYSIVEIVVLAKKLENTHESPITEHEDI